MDILATNCENLLLCDIAANYFQVFIIPPPTGQITLNILFFIII